MSAPVYTAAQIAAALGFRKAWVLKRLAGVPAGTKAKPAQPVKAWEIEQLPFEWQKKLHDTANELGAQDVDHMLDEGLTPASGVTISRTSHPEEIARALMDQLVEAVSKFGHVTDYKEVLGGALAKDGGPIHLTCETVSKADTRHALDPLFEFSLTFRGRFASHIRHGGPNREDA